MPLPLVSVTRPFSFEGARRQKIAEEGIDELADRVDALIVIPNDRLLALTDYKVTVDNAFKIADDVLTTGVQRSPRLSPRPVNKP